MSQNTILYIKGDRDVEVQDREVTLGAILSMECTDPKLLARVKSLRIAKIPEKGGQRMVISILRVIECIHRSCPSVDVQNLGETDIIVTYEEQEKRAGAFHLAKTALVAAITFCGAAFTIMTFNNDVDVTQIFAQIYQLVTGTRSDGFTVLEVTYSIGLTAGILIFFNHFGKKRFTADPTPMEVQMRLYENDIQTTLVESASRKGEELDAGTDHTGSHRS